MIRFSSILFGLACAASCSAVDLAWDAASLANGATNQIQYRLVYGPESGQYTNSMTIGTKTATSVTLPAGKHFLAVYAVCDGIISELPSIQVASDYSNEIFYEFAQPTTIIGTLIIR